MSRDEHSAPGQRRSRQFLARLVSELTNPVLVTIPLVLLVARRGTSSWIEALQWASLYLLLADLGPAVVLMELVRHGRLADLGRARRAERVRPLVISLAALVGTAALFHFMDAPFLMQQLAWIQLTQAALMTAITPAWQISFHGATSGSLAATVLLLCGSAAWPVAGLLPLVGWSQVVRGRHTAGQVAAGACLGILVYGLGLTL